MIIEGIKVEILRMGFLKKLYNFNLLFYILWAFLIKIITLPFTPIGSTIWFYIFNK